MRNPLRTGRVALNEVDHSRIVFLYSSQTMAWSFERAQGILGIGMNWCKAVLRCLNLERRANRLLMLKTDSKDSGATLQ